MRTFSGLQSFRAAVVEDIKTIYERTCQVTGKVFDEPLKPAIVIVDNTPYHDITLSGPVGPKVKAGQKDQAGRKVKSVTRKDVVLDVQVTSHLTIVATRKVG